MSYKTAKYDMYSYVNDSVMNFMLRGRQEFPPNKPDWSNVKKQRSVRHIYGLINTSDNQSNMNQVLS